jgi:hypothetical protein
MGEIGLDVINHAIHSTVHGKDGEEGDNEDGTAEKPLTKEAQAVKKEIDKIKDKCSDIDIKKANNNDNGWNKGGAAAIGGVVTAALGAGLLWHVTDSAQKAELDKAQQEAIQEFMDNVGSKIKCYIGSTPVGTYGQVIPTSM